MPVPPELDEWTAAEVLKDEFVRNQSQRDAIDTTAHSFLVPISRR